MLLHGVLHMWNYVMCSVDLVGSLFQSLEDAIHEHFTPAPTGWIPVLSWNGNYLLCLVDLVFLNVANLTTLCEFQLSALKKISGPLSSLSNDFSILSIHLIKFEIRQIRHPLSTSIANFADIKSHLDPMLQHNIELLTTKYSSV